MMMSEPSRTTAAYLKLRPEQQALHIMSELDYGMRGLIAFLANLVRHGSPVPQTAPFEDKLDQLTHLRSALHSLAVDLDLRLVARGCDDIGRQLNELRARHFKVRYGRLHPSAAVLSTQDIWKALMARWDALLSIVPRFAHDKDLHSLRVLHAKAHRLESDSSDTSSALESAAETPRP